jgi:hypothetical protein
VNMRTTLAALAMVTLIGAGCSSENTGSGGTKTSTKGMRFAECMRDNGVTEFPDPDASGELTIDGVLNGSSLDSSTPVWKEAMATCKDLQPPGFTGDDNVTASEQDARLEFAQCIRDHGVKDFPDPAKGDPLVDTRRIPSSAEPGGMDVLNAAMQTCGELAERANGQ